ncbi:MAG: divalent-cation tolerance protein CutA [Pseudomonadota bacterium]|nr:divalent-cation tolerance protein CutA [Pseudomonadota bacterium]
MSSPPALRIVLTTLPNAEIAGRLAREMVEARLAACVNVLPPCRSIYRWQDATQEDVEIPLIIKTTAERYPALETFLRENHPYQLPEIIAIDVNDGLPDYLRWAAAATQP